MKKKTLGNTEESLEPLIHSIEEMILYLMINYEMYEIACPMYYLPIVLLDIVEHDIQCQEMNSITMLMKNPRSNMDMISAVFHFYFEGGTDDVDRVTPGQVTSRYMIIYDMDSVDEVVTDYYPCVLFLRGKKLCEILFYMPPQALPFRRELLYRFHPRRTDVCPLCLEERPLINLHKNDFRHELCLDCVLHIRPRCPFCRLEIP